MLLFAAGALVAACTERASEPPPEVPAAALERSCDAAGVREVVVAPAGAGLCRVEGDVVHVTSEELTRGGAAFREPVALRVTLDGGWRISAYEVAARPSPNSTSASAEAADVVRRYYTAIDAGDFRRAYELWGDDRAAGGQTFEEFAAGFAETARVEVEIGEPGRVEPAAGSRYVEAHLLCGDDPRPLTAAGGGAVLPPSQRPVSP